METSLSKSPFALSGLRLLAAMIFLLALVAAVGCAAGDGGGDGDGGNDGGNDGGGDGGGNGGGGGGGSIVAFSATTESNGSAESTFNIPDGATKFSIVAELGPTDSVKFTRLADSGGADYLSPSGEMINFGEFSFLGANSVNAPSRSSDPALNAANQFDVQVDTISGRVGGSEAGLNVEFSLVSRADADLNNGTLLVNLFFVGSVAQTAEAKAAVEAAVTEFRRIYREQAGITLNIQTHDIDGPTVLALPVDGDPFYKTAGTQVNFPAVNLYIGGDIEGSEGEVLGVAAGIPGPPIPTIRSAVTASIVTGGGPDGSYSPLEIRLLGETLAHECGHFVGLFHPVDYSGSSVTSSDPLSDTPSCRRNSECEGIGALTSNLMYVTPLSDGNGGLIPQNQLTPQQRAVMNRYAAVD